MPLTFSTKRDPNAGLLPEGIHRFIVETAEEKTGPKGPYAKLRLRPVVKGKKWGSSVWDNLSGSDDSRYRVDAFMDAINAPDQAGEAPLSWFVGKSGWARFRLEEDQNGDLQPKVAAYLSEEKAERALAKLAEKEGTDDEAMTVPTQRRSREIPDDDETPVRAKSGRKTKAAVAELDEGGLDEDVPF